MPNNPLTTKRMLIDQANSRIVISVGLAAFILVFSLVATKTLVSQAAYQNRVIGAKRTAVKQLKADIEATTDLKRSYDAFTSTAQNVIGGNSDGTEAKDGDNAKIILDALPSAYNFPTLTTSLEALASGDNIDINTITGTDDGVAQSANNTSITPTPVEIPFTIAVDGDYGGIQNVVSRFEHSIRPMHVQLMDISGADGKLTLSLTANTFYQPAKSLNIQTRIQK